MSDLPEVNFTRTGNNLPQFISDNNRQSIDRESMYYSYQNTVESSYAGDVRHFAIKFGEYLETKAAYYDVKKNIFIKFPVRYAAPNLAFSDDKGLTGNAPETSIKDRIILPIISYYLADISYDSKRAIDPSVRYRFKPNKNKPGKVLVTTAPKPVNYSFQIDVWTENRESFQQILTAFQLDFNPYSYLTDLYAYDDTTQKTFYMPYAKMNLDSVSDNSNYIPGTDRRVVRATLKITVEGWLTQPPTEKNYIHRTVTNMEGDIRSSDGIITRAGTWNSSAGTVLTSGGQISDYSNLLVGKNSSYFDIIGDGVSNSLIVTHNLHTENIIFQAWEVQGDKAILDCGVFIVSVDAIRLTFSTAPDINSIRVLVLAAMSTTQSGTGGEITAQDVIIEQPISGVASIGDTVQDALAHITTNDAFNILLAQPLPIGSPIRIINGKAYKVTSLDSIAPYVDGITLTAGNTNEIVSVGRRLNMVYPSTLSFTTDDLLYLSQTGGLTTTVPSLSAGDVYLLTVGHALSNTSSFIFNSQIAIKLI